jgi:hypothetical protein
LKFRLCFFLITFFVSSASIAQKQIVSQNHSWAMYFGNHRLTDRWGIHSEYQWRRHDFFNSWQQSLMRLGVDYYSKNQAQFTLGYGWIKTFAYGDQPVDHSFNEHRIWQQLVLKNNIGRVEFNHRYRLEQRFLEQWKLMPTDSYEQNGHVFRNRVRYRFMATVPLSRKELNDNTLFLAVYDEPFLQFGKGVAKNILDQNRLYFALGWRFTKDFNIQLGYLNQYIVKTDGIKAERNHTLQIGVTYNVDLRKTK